MNLGQRLVETLMEYRRSRIFDCVCCVYDNRHKLN